MTEVEEIKASIFANPYMDKLRGEHIIDSKAFETLRADMSRLAAVWSRDSAIDKELVGALHELISMTLYQSLSESWEEQERERLWDMYTDLDSAFIECLS